MYGSPVDFTLVGALLALPSSRLLCPVRHLVEHDYLCQGVADFFGETPDFLLGSFSGGQERRVACMGMR